MALSRFFLPTKQNGHTVSELMSTRTSFFSELELLVSVMILLYIYNVSTTHKNNKIVITRKNNLLPMKHIH